VKPTPTSVWAHLTFCGRWRQSDAAGSGSGHPWPLWRAASSRPETGGPTSGSEAGRGRLPARGDLLRPPDWKPGSTAGGRPAATLAGDTACKNSRWAAPPNSSRQGVFRREGICHS
jgi:hypothetical protein